MAKLKDIIVAGDIHGEWGYLNKLINLKKPKIILQCGDFGWWPRMDWDCADVKNPNTEIYWCPGNHEDWDDLDKYKKQTELYPRIHYMPRGTTHTLPDGRVVLFIGGAYSIDKNRRTVGIDWFPQEIIPASVIYRLMEDNVKNVDIVISHTCPAEFNHGVNKAAGRMYNGWHIKFEDPSQEVLSEVLHEYKPSLWYFGHFHVNASGVYEDTTWRCLNMTTNTGWWKYLPE